MEDLTEDFDLEGLESLDTINTRDEDDLEDFEDFRRFHGVPDCSEIDGDPSELDFGDE